MNIASSLGHSEIKSGSGLGKRLSSVTATETKLWSNLVEGSEDGISRKLTLL